MGINVGYMNIGALKALGQISGQRRASAEYDAAVQQALQHDQIVLQQKAQEQAMRQFQEEMALRNRQFGEQQYQFDRNAGQQDRQMSDTDRRFYESLSQSDRQFLDNYKENQRQFNVRTDQTERFQDQDMGYKQAVLGQNAYQFDQGQAFQGEQAGLNRDFQDYMAGKTQGFQATEAQKARDAQRSMYNDTLAEGQFTGDRAFYTGVDQFNRTLDYRQTVADQSLAYKYDALSDKAKQFAETIDLKKIQIDQNGRIQTDRMNMTERLAWDRLDSTEKMTIAQIASREGMFGQNLELQYDKLTQTGQMFLANMDFKNAQLDQNGLLKRESMDRTEQMLWDRLSSQEKMAASQIASREKIAERGVSSRENMFGQTLEQRKEEFLSNFGLANTKRNDQVFQFAESIASKEDMFGQNLELDTAKFTHDQALDWSKYGQTERLAIEKYANAVNLAKMRQTKYRMNMGMYGQQSMAPQEQDPAMLLSQQIDTYTNGGDGNGPLLSPQAREQEIGKIQQAFKIAKTQYDEGFIDQREFATIGQELQQRMQPLLPPEQAQQEKDPVAERNSVIEKSLYKAQDGTMWQADVDGNIIKKVSDPPPALNAYGLSQDKVLPIVTDALSQAIKAKTTEDGIDLSSVKVEDVVNLGNVVMGAYNQMSAKSPYTKDESGRLSVQSSKILDDKIVKFLSEYDPKNPSAEAKTVLARELSLATGYSVEEAKKAVEDIVSQTKATNVSPWDLPSGVKPFSNEKVERVNMFSKDGKSYAVFAINGKPTQFMFEAKPYPRYVETGGAGTVVVADRSVADGGFKVYSPTEGR